MKQVKDALKTLNIEDYYDRIWNSNSKGELFHLMDYIKLAEILGENKSFRPFFVERVKWAEKTWNRPESIFQHIFQIIRDTDKQTKQ